MRSKSIYAARNPRVPLGGYFVLRWTIANVAGWSVGLAGGFAVVSRFSEQIGHALSPLSADLGISLVGAMVGMMTIPVGMAQWVVVRRHFDHPGLWVVASTVGWIIGLAIGWSASMALQETSGDVLRSAAMGGITGAIGGAAAGTMQWIVMWQEDKSRPWWLPLSILGWAAAFAAAWSVAWLAGRLVDLISTYAIIGTIVGAFGGAITGVALDAVLRVAGPERQAAATTQYAARNS